MQAQTVVSDLAVPWGIAFLPDGDWLVTERPGRVRRLREGRLSPSPVATIPRVASAEGGLMGIALHPEFARNRAFFLYASVEKPRQRGPAHLWTTAGTSLAASIVAEYGGLVNAGPSPPVALVPVVLW